MKIKNAYSKLGMTAILLFILGCQGKTPTDDDKTSDFSTSTHEPIPQKRKAQLFEVGNKNVPIAIVESHQGIYTKTHLLISEDSVFNKNAYDKRNDLSFYQGLYQKYWNTDYDWYVNAMLYSKFEVGAIGMSSFVPDNVEKWRSEAKKENGVFWRNFLDTVKSVNTN
jgi:hypothetical protein